MSYDVDKIKFKTYSWGFGTTSFRESELKYKIEKQLLILEEYRDYQKEKKWSDFQEEYFYYLVDKKLAKATANDKKKDSRIKTSSLKDLGLIDKERFLQETSKELLRIIKDEDYKDNNVFGIGKENFLYLKQFLKIEFSKNIESPNYSEFNINPFLAIVYSLLKNENKISKDFFTYILPTIKNYEELKEVLNKDLSSININNYLLNKIKSMVNYQNALACFKTETIDESIFKDKNVFMNMNGGSYDIKYLKFYKSLKKYKTDDLEEKKLENIENIQYPSGNIIKKVFYNLMFNQDKKPKKAEYNSTLIRVFENSFVFKYSTSFEENFFYMIHLEKWKKNLEEYYDLNKRFLELTNLFIFENEFISLDEIGYIVFSEKKNDLLNIPLSSSKESYIEHLYSNKELNKISTTFTFDKEHLLTILKERYPEIDISADLNAEINRVKSKRQKNKLDALIDSKFSNEKIKELLLNIKNRNADNDNKVLKYLEWDTDIPTIFEYIIGIVWYKASNRQGNLIDFLNLSLDAKLLPRRFAGGGQSDIIYKYEDGHDVLLEVTLSNKENQRKMELEPVSRHLGRYMLENGNNHYAIFIAPFLDPNVLVGLRSYSKLNYYQSSNTDNFVSNLKIFPLDIDNIICIIENNISYVKIKELVESSFISDEFDGLKWYNSEIKDKLICINS